MTALLQLVFQATALISKGKDQGRQQKTVLQQIGESFLQVSSGSKQQRSLKRKVCSKRCQSGILA